MRVVSLLPAATEVLCGVGGRDLLVGRSHECDFPTGLDGVPEVTSATAEPIGARAIHEAAAETGMTRLDTGALADLMPDVLLTQRICPVCAVDEASARTVARHMLAAFGRKPEVIALSGETIEGVLDDHLAVGRVVRKEAEATAAVAALRERMYRAESFVPAFADRPRIGFLEWTDPLFIAGHWNVELIERAGGEHPLNPMVGQPRDGAADGPQRGARRAGKSKAVPPELFAASLPEWLVIAPCGMNLGEAWTEAEKLKELEWFRELPASKAGRVAVVDGSAMFNRPGPRLIEAFEFLVGWVQGRPELIPDGFPWRVLAE